MQILTQEQRDKSEQEINEFLLSLDFNLKINIVRLLEPFIKTINCEHNWLSTDEYENNLPKNSKICRKCNLIKSL